MFPVKSIIDFYRTTEHTEVAKIFFFLEIYKNLFSCVDPLATYRMWKYRYIFAKWYRMWKYKHIFAKGYRCPANSALKPMSFPLDVL